MKIQPFALSQTGTEAALLIYGDIGSDVFSPESVSATSVVAQLGALPASVGTINVRINSAGGSVADGLAIYNALRSHPARIVASVEGVAASVASLIAMAGDDVRMYAASLMMIHAPWANASGNAADMRDFAAVLDTYAGAMASAYARKTGRTADAVHRDWLGAKDTWFTAAEAKAAGLCDYIIEAETAPKPEPSIARGLAKYTERVPLKIAAALRKLGVPDMNTTATEPVASTRETIMAELRDRNNQIRAVARGFDDFSGVGRLVADALADPSVSAADFNASLLRTIGAGATPLTPQGFISIGNNNQNDFLEGASDALLIRAGLRLAKPHPAAKDLIGMSLMDLGSAIIGRQGRTLSGRPGADQIVKALHGTSDFPLLLSNSANKSLQIGFENEPASHRVWVRSVDCNDFKLNSRVQRSEAPGLLEIQPGGEYTYGSFGEREETYSLATFGRIFSITRQALINDDLAAFTTLPQAFGAAAARLEADKVYSILTANAAMSDSVALFHATHGNLTASGTAISTASLGVARSAMRKQMGQSGLAFLNIVPRFLIVPAALETVAEVVVASTVSPNGNNATPNAAFIQGLTLVVDPRLDANSATAWYLAGDASQIDTVEIGYLRGQRGVFTEENIDFNTDAFSLKARLDFGTAAIDYRGLYKNVGA